jgi:hypothetical protein
MALPKTSLTTPQRLLLLLFSAAVVYQAGFSAAAFDLLRNAQSI